MKKFFIFSLLLCVLLMAITLSSCQKKYAEITNISFTDGIDYSDMEEPFYEDEQYVYIFPAIMSYDCTIYYSDGSRENIVDALKAGRATPADLDRFDILYYTHAK